MRWEDLDLDEGTLSVVRQLHRRDGQFITGPPKSKAGTRTIALDDETTAHLGAHGERHGQSGFVFTRADGEPLSPERLTRLIHTYGEKAGLPPVRFHDLRHGAASLALAAGADLKVVQDMLGHASIVLTADTYTSVLPETSRQAAADTAALIRDAGRIVPGTRRPRCPEYPRRLEPEPEEFPEAA